MESAERWLESTDGRLDSAERQLESADGRLDSAEPQLESADGRFDSTERRLQSEEGQLESAKSAESRLVDLAGRLELAGDAGVKHMTEAVDVDLSWVRVSSFGRTEV